VHNMPFLNVSLTVAFWRRVVEEIQIIYSVIWTYVKYTFLIQVHCLEVMQRFHCRWELYLCAVDVRHIYI
jgi:hypothetical protein